MGGECRTTTGSTWGWWIYSSTVGQGVEVFSIAVLQSPGAYIVSVQVKMVMDADLVALGWIINNFIVAAPEL